MIHVMLAIRDSKSEVFGRPFFMSTVGQAIRSFEDEVRREDENNMINRHPEDFALYKLGMYNDEDGQVQTITPQLLMIGNEISNKLGLRQAGISAVS